GEALGWPLKPASSHSCLPVAGSYERTRGLPRHTTSVRFLFFQISGVLQLVRSVRFTRHSSSPVFGSRATRNDFRSLSYWMKRRLPSSTGELAVPWPMFVRYAPRSFFQINLPSMS